MPRLETSNIDDIIGTILNISEICTLNIEFTKSIPRKLKRNIEIKEIKERIKIDLFLVDQYIARRDMKRIERSRDISIFLSYILQFCNTLSITFISLEIF